MSQRVFIAAIAELEARKTRLLEALAQCDTAIGSLRRLAEPEETSADVPLTHEPAGTGVDPDRTSPDNRASDATESTVLALLERSGEPKLR